jgi:hypothetical protein
MSEFLEEAYRKSLGSFLEYATERERATGRKIYDPWFEHEAFAVTTRAALTFHRLMKEQDGELERLRAERDGMQRTIWLLVKENGGAVIVNKDTKEDCPADASIEVTEQPESGCTIFRASQQQERTETK